MGYSGAYPEEDSSGDRIRRGGITKAGNAHLRRIVLESAWCYRHTQSWGQAAQATARAFPRDHRNRMEGAESLAQALHEAEHGRQGPEEDHENPRRKFATGFAGLA